MKDKFTALICKVSGNRFLNVLRDSFVLVASLTLIAGFAIMISSESHWDYFWFIWTWSRRDDLWK